MIKKKWIAKRVALCLCLLLASHASAEAGQVGSHSYVSSTQETSMMTLRVEGLALREDSDDTQVVPYVSGAEFGVYVYSGSGELVPWANPLYPNEPMRIRTGEEDTSFSLPTGVEYYLRQESAPQGYEFDEAALIPVTGDAMVIRNEMTGELYIRAENALGEPVSGVEMEITDEQGYSQMLVTDEKGEVILHSNGTQQYTVVERTCPDGVAMAIRVNGAEGTENGVVVRVESAKRTRVTFEHPSAGEVQLNVQLRTLDEQAQEQHKPLANVVMEVENDPAVHLVTDTQGQANVALMEGTYTITLSYEGMEEVILPFERGQIVVRNGEATPIALEAVQPTGRLMMTLEGNIKEKYGSVSFELDGQVYGPYSFDAEGVAVSQSVPAGIYHVADLQIPEDTQLEDGQTLVLTVEPGCVAKASAVLLSREQQIFTLIAESLDEQGELIQQTLTSDYALTLVDVSGTDVATISAEQGQVTIEGVSGTYNLRMDEQHAALLGIDCLSKEFTLPSEQESVAFVSDQTRVMLSSVDENGMPIAGVVYSLTDDMGARIEVTTDEDGLAVSPLMSAGEIWVETWNVPEDYVSSEWIAVHATGNMTARLTIQHAHKGRAVIQTRVQKLDHAGAMTQTVLSDAEVRLYRVLDDGTLYDTGRMLTTDALGTCTVALEDGNYAVTMEPKSVAWGCRLPQTEIFTVSNAAQTNVELMAWDALGGVRVHLTGADLKGDAWSQVRFELVDEDGAQIAMSVHNGTLYAGELVEGSYILRQTQMPQGYTLMPDCVIEVEGGVCTDVEVPLEEYAVLLVSKTGLTFDQTWRTYVVPLSGQYGVYVQDAEGMHPYPNEEEQATVWANVTVQERAEGKKNSVHLPASTEGSRYYIHELSEARGFATDETYYEVTLYAGQESMVSCAVSSDRGFFQMDMRDADTGAHVTGGTFALLDAVSGETVLEFEMGEEPYQNPRAVSVGDYLLQQKTASHGYMLSDIPQQAITIEPYLQTGGALTAIEMTASVIPSDEALSMIQDVYLADQQGLNLLCVDGGRLKRSEQILMPTLTASVHAVQGERSDIASVVIAGVSDEVGHIYQARVEYCLAGGGWQMSDARMTEALTGPSAVSLADVKEDISAIRMTFIQADTGEEIVSDGFVMGQIALNVEADAQDTVALQADVWFDGVTVYRTAFDGIQYEQPRHDRKEMTFTTQTQALFDTISAGRDGRISGLAFLDENADGWMQRTEAGRYAGMQVSLLTDKDQVVQTVRTGADGRYAFDRLSAGLYQVRFDAGENVVFTQGNLQSDHGISGIEDAREGLSRLIRIDGEHTDELVNVGCVFAAELTGSVLEKMEDGETAGFAGMYVEVRAVSAEDEEEPLVVTTDNLGRFRVGRILPDTYEITLNLPEGYLCQDAEDGQLVRRMVLNAQDAQTMDTVLIEKAGEINGHVRIDEDGDGYMAESAQPLGDVKVKLLRVQNGHSETILETVTDAQGAYHFENLYADSYSVLFELEDDWVFTQYGADSDVYGAVSQTGSTKVFSLEPGDVLSQLDAGVTRPVQLRVQAFQDTQVDGRKGVYEEGLSGVQIGLIRQENGEDAQELTLTTDSKGLAIFTGVGPGVYVLSYQMPGAWRATKQVEAEDTRYPVSCVPQSEQPFGRSEPFVLSMNEQETQLYIGAMLSGAIGGKVYEDADANASMDERENANTDVLVELLASDGQVLSQTKPDETGEYRFEGLAPGRYTVRFTAPEGCGFSGTERTATRGGVLASTESVSSTRVLTVVSGETIATAHAGVVHMSGLSGAIWEDRNGDQIWNEDEWAVEGIAVHLMDGAGRNILQSVETDAQGHFAFDTLQPGSYKLRMDATSTYVFSGEQIDSPLPLDTVRDGRGYSQAFTLLGGAQVENIRFGLLTQGAISGFVWEDLGYDGVWDDTEMGLRGTTVTLLDADGMEVAQKQTARTGEFMFERLMPGEYTLHLMLPTDYVFTTGCDDLMHVDESNHEANMPLGMLTMGENLNSVRVGALKSASVSGVVWYDVDDDGRRAVNEAGLADVCVKLTVCSGMDAGKVLQTQTDADGAYRFDAVMPGEAVLDFELPHGFVFAKQVAGTRRVSRVPSLDAEYAETEMITIHAGDQLSDWDVGTVGVGTISGNVWYDADNDGTWSQQEADVFGANVALIDTATGQTVAEAQTDENGLYQLTYVRQGTYALQVTLPEGMVFATEGESILSDVDHRIAQTEAFRVAMGENHLNMNVGAIVPAKLTGRVAVDTDGNGQADETEAGMNGVMVTLMQGGTALTTVYTDANGNFQMEGIRPGTYRVRYMLGADVLFAQDVALRMTNPDAIEAETDEFALCTGDEMEIQAVPTVWAARISGRIFVDDNVNGAIDQGEAALEQVQAELLDEQGRVLRTVQVQQGEYAFEQLRQGTYSVRFTLPQPMLFTEYTGREGDSCVPVVEGQVGVTHMLTLGMGEHVDTVNMGAILPGRVGDTIWHDLNGNGLQDYKEPLVPNVSLTLLKMQADGTLEEVATTTSNAYGYYAFTSLRPGTYVVQYNLREGDVLTLHYGQPMGEIDSDVDPNTGSSEVILLHSGQTIRNVDVGLIECASGQ